MVRTRLSVRATVKDGYIDLVLVFKFDLIQTSDEKFYCFPCFMARRMLEVKELHSMVASLSSELADLRSSITTNLVPLPTDNNHMLYSNVVTSNSDDTDNSSAHSVPSSVSAGSVLLYHSAPPPKSTSKVDERKYTVFSRIDTALEWTPPSNCSRTNTDVDNLALPDW